MIDLDKLEAYCEAYPSHIRGPIADQFAVLIAELRALRALHQKLPRCIRCGRLATKAGPMLEVATSCDACTVDAPMVNDAAYAAELRKVEEVQRG